MSRIKNLIQEMSADPTELCAQVCVVERVDTEKRTADLRPIDGSAPLLDANLQADQGGRKGVVVLPRVGSYVVAVLTHRGRGSAVVLTDDVEEVLIDADRVTLNQGRLGGLVKVEPLTARLNALEDDVNRLKSLVGNWVPTAQDGGAGLKATLMGWYGATLRKTEREDLEDEKIRH